MEQYNDSIVFDHSLVRRESDVLYCRPALWNSITKV